ncbi:hypothetical protein [Streptosporangium lutulentum]|uniref:Uncharacterized protein n=1 Tax=Streptosporangium lutulentum TaxID=1461250 RepID=A0ABT9QNR0_9ACTN|nr:hypothetical protein [Streptosporangium lutulentum]MDP9848408.1 hypothetical protein [Streptosporangium lutulentum]
MTTLERRYRRLLLAYPRGYRSAHGDEILDLLLDTAEPGSSLPSLKETAGLFAGGLRARVTQAARGPAWVDGLHLGVTALTVVNLAVLVPYTRSLPLWVALSALAVLAVLRGWLRPALPLVLVTGVKAGALATGTPLLDHTLLPVFPDFLVDSALYSTGGLLGAVAGHVLAFAGLLALAACGQPVRTRSWCWLLPIPLLAAADPAWLGYTVGAPPPQTRIIAEFVLFGLGIWAGRMAGDLRWALASTIYLLAVSVSFGESLGYLSTQDVAYWGLLVLLTLFTAAVPYGRRRHALR